MKITEDKGSSPQCLIGHYNGADSAVTYDEFYRAPIFRYESIDQIPWVELANSKFKRLRLLVAVPGKPLHLDALFIPRKSHDLMVFAHGALFQDRVKFPYFQLVKTMVPSRTESLLFIFDTTMLLDKNIFTSYFLGTPDQDLVSDYADLITSSKRELQYRRVLLAGHSAGGVAALMIGSRISDSLAIAGNPFILDEEFLVPHLEDYRKGVFPNFANAREMIDAHADRFYMRLRLENRVARSSFVWYVYQHDAAWRKHGTIKRLVQQLNLNPYGGLKSEGDSLLLVNWEYPSSPHNMPFEGGKYTFLPLIDYALGKPITFDLNLVCDEEDRSGSYTPAAKSSTEQHHTQI